MQFRLVTALSTSNSPLVALMSSRCAILSTACAEEKVAWLRTGTLIVRGEPRTRAPGRSVEGKAQPSTGARNLAPAALERAAGGLVEVFREVEAEVAIEVGLGISVAPPGRRRQSRYWISI